MNTENTTQIFAFDSHAIRVVGTPEEPLFVAKDVCEALEISKYRDAVARLDEDEGCPVIVDTPGGKQEMSGVTEAGLYSLIFRSNKAESKTFKRWVTHEVLPSIRKTGIYASKSKIKELTLEVEELEKRKKFDSRRIIELYQRDLFKGSTMLFLESRWAWRMYEHFESFKKCADKSEMSSSMFSTRVKRYKHYLDATISDRRIINNLEDSASYWQLFKAMEGVYFKDIITFEEYLCKNDWRFNNINHLLIKQAQENLEVLS
ncbi:MAG: BRO family protein [Balneola sp.]